MAVQPYSEVVRKLAVTPGSVFLPMTLFMGTVTATGIELQSRTRAVVDIDVGGLGLVVLLRAGRDVEVGVGRAGVESLVSPYFPRSCWSICPWNDCYLGPPDVLRYQCHYYRNIMELCI